MLIVDDELPDGRPFCSRVDAAERAIALARAKPPASGERAAATARRAARLLRALGHELGQTCRCPHDVPRVWRLGVLGSQRLVTLEALLADRPARRDDAEYFRAHQPLVVRLDARTGDLVDAHTGDLVDAHTGDLVDARTGGEVRVDNLDGPVWPARTTAPALGDDEVELLRRRIGDDAAAKLADLPRPNPKPNRTSES